MIRDSMDFLKPSLTKVCFKTYLNHPINQKTLQKKPMGDHSSQKRGGGGGPSRYDYDHKFNVFF